jgi:phosphopantetheinyl transferase
LPTCVHFAAVAVEPEVASEQQFTAKEIEQHKAFPVEKRRNEWRAGRLAAKAAVLATRSDLAATDIEVQGDDQGRPRLYIQGKESALWLSISHRDGLAVAAVSPAAVGVDLEVPEDKPQSFLQEAFAVTELRSLLEAADPKTDTACLWAAKEAALKRAGVGLKADLRKHIVTPDGEGGARVEGPAVNGGYGVKFYTVDGKVLAVSAPACDPKVSAAV